MPGSGPAKPLFHNTGLPTAGATFMSKKPRISVNELAHFMVASETARHGIVRRAREPKDFVVTRYRDVRASLCTYLADPSHNADTLEDAEIIFIRRAADPTESDFRRDDAKQSIEVIHAIPTMLKDLAKYNFVPAPQRQKKLLISGVEVSVRADLYVVALNTNGNRVGSAVLRMTKDDTATPAAQDKRKQMGLYAATLAMMHMNANNTQKNRTPAAQLCLAIDVQHGKVFAAPRFYKKRASDLQSACTTIAALWGHL